MNVTTATLVSAAASPSGAVEFTFAPSRPLRHRAGQAGLLVVPGGGARPFTFSSDANTDTISIATSLASGSRLNKALGALAAGARITVVGGFGGLPEITASAEQVFVAQGIGITPFLSLTRTLGAMNATLLQVGAPHYFDEVAARSASAEHTAHRTDLQDAVARAIAARPTADWSISGRGDFVASVAAQLRQAGVPARRIHKAAFIGMRPAAAGSVAPVPAVA